MKRPTKKDRMFQARMERLLNGYERAGKRDVFNAIKSQYSEVLLDIQHFPISKVIERLEFTVKEDPIMAFMRKYYISVGGTVALIYRKNLISQKSEDDEWINIFEGEMDSWLKFNAAKKVTKMTETTQGYIRDLLYSAEENGLGVPEIAKDIRSQIKTIGRSRSLTIARTEITTASSISAHNGIKSTGIKTKKYWMNSGLDGIRDSHIYAQQSSYAEDGISEDAPFSNGLQFAHDPSGPPSEVINCRCTTIYKPV